MEISKWMIVGGNNSYVAGTGPRGVIAIDHAVVHGTISHETVARIHVTVGEAITCRVAVGEVSVGHETVAHVSVGVVDSSEVVEEGYVTIGEVVGSDASGSHAAVACHIVGHRHLTVVRAVVFHVGCTVDASVAHHLIVHDDCRRDVQLS